jgi:hypothetical protein
MESSADLSVLHQSRPLRRDVVATIIAKRGMQQTAIQYQAQELQILVPIRRLRLVLPQPGGYVAGKGRSLGAVYR